MITLLARRLARAVVALFLLTFGTMLLVDLSPVDPARAIAGESATPEVIEQLNEKFRFNDPLITRYFHWMGDVLQGDLGNSIYTRQPVKELIVQRIPTTIELTVISMLIVVLVVVPLGLYLAYKAGTFIDRAVLAVNYAFLSIPTFVLGLTLVLLFVYGLDVLPVSGWVGPREDLSENLKYLAMPVLTLSIAESSNLLQVFRADVVDTLHQEHILLARSKGLSTARILARHALRLSSLSLVTLMGLSFARLLGGAIIVEVVFALPGLGSLMLGAIQSNDMVLVQGLVLLIGISYLVINLIVDVLYAWLDPRVRAA